MNLTLKTLNEDASLNNWVDTGGSAKVIRGADANVMLQLFQVDRKIRYVPAVGAVVTAALLKSDGTLLNKTLTAPFADDRSIQQLALSDTETADLISQNLIVKVVEGSNTSYAILQLGLQMASTSQEGC